MLQGDLLFVKQLLGSDIQLKDVDCGNTFKRKNLITTITKSTYSPHLYSTLQTPTLAPNRAKAKGVGWALQMLFAYMVWVTSCKYPKCQTAFQVLCGRKSSQCCLLFKRKGSKGNFMRITEDFYEECCIVTHWPAGLHLKEYTAEHQPKLLWYIPALCFPHWGKGITNSTKINSAR